MGELAMKKIEHRTTPKGQWTIIFCSECGEPTPPISGMITDYQVFICDECLNTEMDQYDESP